MKRKPQRLRMGLTDWLRPVITCPEEEVVSVAGMDAAVFLRLINYGLVLFAFCTVWCCVLLIPINATVGGWGVGGGLGRLESMVAANELMDLHACD